MTKRRFDDTTWDAPCMERNLVTLLCFSTEHAVEVANLCAQHESTRKDGSLTDTNLRKICEVALEYIRTYNRPPELHIFDLLQHEWQVRGNTQLEKDLTEMLEFSEHVHTEWVLQTFHMFARQKWRDMKLMEALRMANSSLNPEDEAKIDEVIRQAIGGGELISDGSLVVETADELWRAQLPARRKFLPGIIEEGLTILSGAPKAGKSRLMMQIALALAGELDQHILGKDVYGCEFLYLAAEPGRRGVDFLLKKMLDHEPSRYLHCVYDVPRIDNGLVDAIRKHKEKYPDLGAVGIDTLAYIRDEPKSRNEQWYQLDSKLMIPFQRLAAELQIAIIMITHDRKTTADHFLSQVGGTHGLTGVADTVIGLSGSPKEDKRRLQVTGRYVPELDRALQSDPERLTFDDIGFWSDNTAKGEDNTQRKVIGALQKNPLSLEDLIDTTGKSRPSIYRVLRALKGDGIVLYDTKTKKYSLESGVKLNGETGKRYDA